MLARSETHLFVARRDLDRAYSATSDEIAARHDTAGSPLAGHHPGCRKVPAAGDQIGQVVVLNSLAEALVANADHFALDGKWPGLPVEFGSQAQAVAADVDAVEPVVGDDPRAA